MVSVYTYLRFGTGNGIHLHIFQFWGPDMVSIYTYFNCGAWIWCPFIHISIWDPDMVSIYTYFKLGAWKWGPFTHISILGPEIVSIDTYFKVRGREWCPFIHISNLDPNVVGLWAQTAPGNLARQIVAVGRIFCPHLFLFQLVWPNQSIEALEGHHLASGKHRGAPWGILRLG